MWKYLAYIKEELLIVLGTSSSESVLPRMMTKMEDFGCSKPVVGLVIPTGYSFNLDGTTIYLSMATIFLAQVFHVDLSLGQQLTIIAILLVTSKASSRSNRWRLYCTSVYFICDECYSIRRVSTITWCDRFMSEARAIVNLIGNGIATVVVAKSENEFDEEKYTRVIEEMKKEWSDKKSAKLTFYFCRKEVCYGIHYLLTIIYKCFMVEGYKDY